MPRAGGIGQRASASVSATRLMRDNPSMRLECAGAVLDVAANSARGAGYATHDPHDQLDTTDAAHPMPHDVRRKGRGTGRSSCLVVARPYAGSPFDEGGESVERGA
jgi:hypothetical protein